MISSKSDAENGAAQTRPQESSAVPAPPRDEADSREQTVFLFPDCVFLSRLARACVSEDRPQAIPRVEVDLGVRFVGKDLGEGPCLSAVPPLWRHIPKDHDAVLQPSGYGRLKSPTQQADTMMTRIR